MAQADLQKASDGGEGWKAKQDHTSAGTDIVQIHINSPTHNVPSWSPSQVRRESKIELVRPISGERRCLSTLALLVE